MEKKLYYEFNDGGEASRIVMELSAAMEWIRNDELKEGDDREYTLIPVWLTDEEYNNLHKADN